MVKKIKFYNPFHKDFKAPAKSIVEFQRNYLIVCDRNGDYKWAMDNILCRLQFYPCNDIPAGWTSMRK